MPNNEKIHLPQKNNEKNFIGGRTLCRLESPYGSKITEKIEEATCGNCKKIRKARAK